METINGIKVSIDQIYALIDDIIIDPNQHRTDEELDIIKIDSTPAKEIVITLKSGEVFLISKEGETRRAT